MTDLYGDLGIDRDATAKEVKAAYRRLAKSHHPDVGGDAEQFNRIQLAFDVLGDETRRARYDRTGRTDKPKVTPEAIQAIINRTIGAMIAAQRPDGSTDDPGWEDIKKKVLTTIRNGRRDLMVNKSEVDRKLQRLDQLAKRFKSKTDADPVGEAFAIHRENLVKEKHQLEDALEMNLAIEQVFISYDYEVGPRPEGHDSPGPTIRLSGPRYFTSTTAGG